MLETAIELSILMWALFLYGYFRLNRLAQQPWDDET